MWNRRVYHRTAFSQLLFIGIERPVSTSASCVRRSARSDQTIGFSCDPLESQKLVVCHMLNRSFFNHFQPLNIYVLFNLHCWSTPYVVIGICGNAERHFENSHIKGHRQWKRPGFGCLTEPRVETSAGEFLYVLWIVYKRSSAWQGQVVTLNQRCVNVARQRVFDRDGCN